MMRNGVFFLLYAWTSLYAAGPMTHLWVAERFCEVWEIADKETIQAIFIGTQIPDIRYLTQAPRTSTHPAVTQIHDICTSKTPFEAGMKLHAWLDHIREQSIEKDVYDAVAQCEEHKRATLLKFIEEEVLADWYDGRKHACYFDEVLAEERLLAQDIVLEKWHQIIQYTMSFRPSWLLWAQSYRHGAFGVSADLLYAWSYLLPELKNKELFKRHMHKLLKQIDTQLKTHRAECKAQHFLHP